MTDFTNHIGKNVEVMTKKGMAIGELVFYGEHASKVRRPAPSGQTRQRPLTK